MQNTPQPVAPAIFTLNPDHPDVALATISRYIIAQVDDLRANTVSVDDLATGMAALAQLASTFFSALDSSVADRRSLHDEDARIAGLVTALTARVTALENRTLTGTTGQLTKNLTLGLGGTTTTYGVTFAKPMPTADYLPLVTLDSSSVALLGTTTYAPPVTNKTAFGCTVTVRNSAALTLASSVTVQVAALALT